MLCPSHVVGSRTTRRKSDYSVYDPLPLAKSCWRVCFLFNADSHEAHRIAWTQSPLWEPKLDATDRIHSS